MNLRLRYRLLMHVAFIWTLVLAGTIGYMLIEHWSFLDAVFMTVTTLTTVGFGETHPLSVTGRVYTIILILFGVGLLLYILGEFAELIIEINPTAIFGTRRMKEKIAKLDQHQIVCGYGRTGQEVIAHFVQNAIPFVIVESDAMRAKLAEDRGYLVVLGDATEDNTLIDAGISQARGIVCAVPDDADNTFIVLSARGLNEKITIVSRAANPGTAEKMKRAGAHVVISPFVISGRRMATAVTHPLVLEFLDVVMHSPAYDLRMEQVVICPGSTISGTMLKDANIKQKSGAMVLAVNQQGKLMTNPLPDLVFQNGDELIAIGADEQLKKLSQLAGNQSNKG